MPAPEDLNPRTSRFALRIIKLYNSLPRNDGVAQVLGKQVLRFGTSIGANYREAARSRSKPEFVAKIGDCLKQTVETEYRLELISSSGLLHARQLVEIIDETRQLMAMFTTINKRSKTNL